METHSKYVAQLFFCIELLIGCQPSGTLNEESPNNATEESRQKTISNTPVTMSSTYERKEKKTLDAGANPKPPSHENPNPGPKPPSHESPNPIEQGGDFWWGNTCTAPVYPSNKAVSDEGSFLSALKNAKPGDVIFLQAGKVFQQSRTGCMDIVGVHGTPGNPVIVTSDASNPAVISGGECGLAVMDSSHLEISNIKINGLSHWGMDIGGLKEGQGRPMGVNNVTVRNVEVGYTGIEGIEINSASHHVTVKCSEVHHTGETTPIYGEGIYVGDGSSHDATHHVTISYNNIHHTKAEAVDVKQTTTYIDVLYNYIHNIEVNSQGAITLGIDSINYPSGEYKVVGNRIHDITKRNHDGAGIVVGHGNTWVYNNIIWNIPDSYGIFTQQNFANPNANNVYIHHNTVLNAASGPLGINLIGAHKSGPSNVTSSNNLWESSSTGDLKVTAADFLATQGSADSGQGPGSGLQLKSSSSAYSKTSSVQVVADDILGRRRTKEGGINYGAFQHGNNK
jgi:hypothetical protein